MPIKKLRSEFTFAEDRLKELQQVVPEAFADGKVNWDALQEALGEHLEDETHEHFGLTWPGKREARRLAAAPSKGTLVPRPGEGVNEEDTRNVFIEGENLEVLKLLQKSYAGRVKMIYIDPPYNTGNDLVYSDNYTEPLEAYLRRTGSKDEIGELLTTNTRADGRFHSTWLNMMYPRLLLARLLLREDGVMFVSIDDNEVHHLRQMLNEIFGENCVEEYVWDVREDGTMPKTARGTVRKEHEYLIAAFKSADAKILYKYWSQKYADKDDWTNPDNDPRGPWMSGNISRGSGEGTGAKAFTIVNPHGIKFSRAWAIDKDEYERLLADNRIFFANGGKGVPRLKIFRDEAVESIQSSIFEGLGSSQSGKKQIQDLLGDIEFSYPKPTKLIKRIIEVSTMANDLVLDFFAGSSTTAHALFELNIEQGKNRPFILVQLPEGVDDEKYTTISQLGKDRLRQFLKTVDSSSVNSEVDLGFCCFELEKSQYKQWQEPRRGEDAQVEFLFQDAEQALIPGWETKTLLMEIVLLQGFPLHSKVEYEKDLLLNQVYRVSCDWHDHYLLICLDDKVDELTIANLKIRSGDIFICLDTALSDENKVRLADQTNLHVI